MSTQQREMQKQVIRVIYPQDGARIALRTDVDWDFNIEAVGRKGCTEKFAKAEAGLGTRECGELSARS
jgi:hypothetical protein